MLFPPLASPYIFQGPFQCPCTPRTCSSLCYAYPCVLLLLTRDFLRPRVFPSPLWTPYTGPAVWTACKCWARERGGERAPTANLLLCGFAESLGRSPACIRAGRWPGSQALPCRRPVFAECGFGVLQPVLLVGSESASLRTGPVCDIHPTVPRARNGVCHGANAHKLSWA